MLIANKNKTNKVESKQEYGRESDRHFSVTGISGLAPPPHLPVEPSAAA
jgi:hypothetical protein